MQLEQKGLLRRFSVTCYGHQESVEEMRAHKADKFKELKQNRNSEEFQEWFLNYKPDDVNNKNSDNINKNKPVGKTGSKKIKNKDKDTDKNKSINKSKSTKKQKPKGSTSIFNIYGRKTRKNKNELY